MSKLNQAAFAAAKKCMGKRNTIPILDCALVRDNVLHATNMDQQISHRVEGLDDGLYDIPKSHAIKEGVKADAKMKEHDFPFIATPECAPSAVFDCETLHHVGQFVSLEETRYYLNGIFFTHDKIVATDGHTICVSRKHAHDLPDVIVPWEAIKLLPKKGKVWVCAHKAEKESGDQHINKLTLKVSNDYVILSKAVDGKYPDYRRALPAAETPNNTLPEDWYARCDREIKLKRASGEKRWLAILPITDGAGHEYGFNCEYLQRMPAQATAFYQSSWDYPARFDIATETYAFMPMRA